MLPRLPPPFDASLLLRLSGEAHARCVGKFVEQGFEKLDRLVELHEKYHRQVAPPPPASAFSL